MNDSRDDFDGLSLQRIEQALLAEDPDFVRRLRARSATLPATPVAQVAPVDRASLLVALWCVAGALVLLSLAAGSLVGAAGTCLLFLVLHRRTRGAGPVTGAAPLPPGPRAPGRSTPPER